MGYRLKSDWHSLHFKPPAVTISIEERYYREQFYMELKRQLTFYSRKREKTKPGYAAREKSPSSI
jgi:hypothetical protein